jgi:hypothetical protein
MKPKPLVALKNLTVPVWAIGETPSPVQSLVVLPATWRRGQFPVVASAVMHWRMVKPPAENGAVRDSQYRGKVVQNVPLSGSQMPEHGIYRTET